MFSYFLVSEFVSEAHFVIQRGKEANVWCENHTRLSHRCIWTAARCFRSDKNVLLLCTSWRWPFHENIPRYLLRSSVDMTENFWKFFSLSIWIVKCTFYMPLSVQKKENKRLKACKSISVGAGKTYKCISDWIFKNLYLLIKNAL